MTFFNRSTRSCDYETIIDIGKMTQIELTAKNDETSVAA